METQQISISQQNSLPSQIAFAQLIHSRLVAFFISLRSTWCLLIHPQLPHTSFYYVFIIFQKTMQMQVWSDSSSWLFNFCRKRQSPYMGPYPTIPLPLSSTTVLLACNCWLYLLCPTTILRSLRLKSQILYLSHAKKLLLIVTKTSVELLNQQLEKVREFDLKKQQVLGVDGSNKGFVVVYQGEGISSHPLVRFVGVTRKAASGYVNKLRVYFEAGKIMIENIEMEFTEAVQLPANEIKVTPTHVECRRIGQILAITADRATTYCLNLQDYSFLYTLPYTKSRQIIGAYILQTKLHNLTIYEPTPTGLHLLGNLPKTDDHVQCLIKIQQEFYLVKQILTDSKEYRRFEKCGIVRQNTPATTTTVTAGTSLKDVSSVGATLGDAGVSIQAKAREQFWRDQAREEEKLVVHTSPSSPRFISEHHTLRPVHSENTYVPCSPIVETQLGYAGALFNTAKDLFLGQIEQQKQQQSSCYDTQDVINQTASLNTACFKHSFGSLASPHPTRSPIESLFQQYNNSIPVTKLLGFIQTSNLDTLKNQIKKKLQLFNPFESVDYETFRYLMETEVLVLVEEFYEKRGSKAEAVESFVREVLEGRPEWLGEVIARWGDGEGLVNKMMSVLSRLDRQQLCRQFRRQCYPYLSQTPLKSVPQPLQPHPTLSSCNLHLLLIFHPQIKLIELSNPSQLLTTILHIYFSIGEYSENPIEELAVDYVTIEDEDIEITNPRNMLNIVMYFGDVFGVEPAEGLRKYLRALLEKGQQDLIDIARNVVYKQSVPQILGLPSTILQDLIKSHQQSLYFHNCQHICNFSRCLQLIHQDLTYKRKARCRLNIIEALEPSNTLIDFSELYMLERNRNGVAFMEGLIRQEEPRVLVGIGLEGLYENVWVLEGEGTQNTKLSFYTRELLGLVDMLVQRCVDVGAYTECLQCMDRIKPRLKVGLILYCILRYLRNQHGQCSLDHTHLYLPRLLRSTRQSLLLLFTNLLDNSQPLQLSPPDTDSELQSSFLCSFQKMRSKLYRCGEEMLSGERLMSYESFEQLLYYRSKMVVVLSRFDRSINEMALRGFLRRMQDQGYFGKIQEKISKPKDICPELPIEYSVPVLERWSPQPRIFENSLKEPNRDHKRRKSYDDPVVRSSHLDVEQYSCFTQRTHYKKMSSMTLRRRQSSPESIDVSELKHLSGNETKITEFLESFYQTNTLHRLLRLLQRSKLHNCPALHHTGPLLSIQQYSIDFDYHKLFPFAVLLQPSPQSAFECLKPNLYEQLNLRNFWIAVYLVQFVLGEQFGREVAKMFVRKQLLCWEEAERAAEAMARVRIVGEYFNIKWEEVKDCLQEARKMGTIMVGVQDAIKEAMGGVQEEEEDRY